eukprot:jgi/Phyca11/20614/fgenesh1_pg.PHYCAscaffold_68_\
MEEDTTPELTTDAPSLLEETVDERQAPLEEPAASEPTVDLPSESSATVDAMYGDAFNDFDDNGGEDEDLTAETGADPDDTHTPATEASSPINNPMQESKSGEALYDDYDEFDEDEPPQDEDVEVEDTPVEDVAAEITALLSQTETEPDPVKNAPEGEEEAEAPAVADAAEDTASAFTGEEGANVDENGGGIDVEPLESELGPGQESQPEVSSNGQTTEEAPSDIEPIVGSAEDQESVNLDVDSAPVPSDENAEEGDPYSIPVDDPDKMPVDDVAESAPDGGTGEKPDGDVELDEVEVAAENDGASAQLESEASEPKLPGENEVSVGSTTIEATANPVQDEDARTDCTAQQDVPPMSDEAVTSLEQDGEAKKLTTDSSVASVHSVVYDDDNFDDEAHNEAGLSEAVDTSAVEETVQVAEPRQEDESPDTTPNPEPIPAVSTDPEDDSKTLVANSSELSVQSAGYDDDGFEDGAQEDPQADTSEDRVSVQEPSGNEHTDSTAVDTPLERASEDKPISPLEDEVPGATTEIPKDDDIENTAADETPKETVPEMVDVSSELKQPDPTTTSESEVVVAPSIEAENESPDSLAQDETTGNIQEPANVEAEKDEEAGQVDENAGGASEGDTVATTEPDETENIVTDPSAVPDTLEDETSETNATPAEDETSEIAIPTETVMAQTEAEAGEEPATYDDDNFADEEEVAPSVAHEEPDLVAKEAAGEGLKGEEPMIQSSEQPSVEIGESVAAVINNEENTGQEGNAGMEESSHPKQPEENVVDSSGGQDKPDDSVQGLTPEGAIPSENVEEAPAESEDVTIDSVPAVPAEAEQVAPNEGNDGTATGDAKEEASQEEKPSIEEIAGDPLQSDKPAEDTTDSSVEAPSTEAPVEVAADEQLEPVQSDAEHTLEAGPLSSEDAYLSDDNPDDALNLVDPVSQENQEVAVSMGDANKVNGDPTEAPEPTAAIVEPSNAAQRAIEDQGSDEPDYADDDETYEEQSPVQDKVSSQKDREVGAESPNDTAQVSENIAETSSEAIETPTPTEVIEPSHKEQPTVEDEASDEPDYAEDDVIEDESPVVVKDESNGSIGPLPPVSAVQGGVNVPELVIENESPEPDQTVAGSEAPKTEDQYDDDDGYNEFDDQEPPTVEVPAPSIATTKAPATEDEYDEYENDEYGEEEKPSKNEPEAVKSTRSSPPVSAREEEINEVADDPEEAEENAYADDQDEYEEDEVPAPVPQSSSPPKPDNAVPKQAEAEASADEYEDDNEEEDYADDEIEDSSPPKPAAAVHPAKSDDEMEEELESEEDYTSD